MIKYPNLYLHKGQEKRLQQGHVWIYSNEINTQISPLSQFTPGSLVNVFAHSGKPLGTAYINPQCLLCARLLSPVTNTILDADFFFTKFQQALNLRTAFYPLPFYRLVFGESDGLPGLIVDRFGDDLVIQQNTAGMDLLTQPIVEALTRLLSPQRIILRNDGGHRQTEKLPSHQSLLVGEGTHPLTVIENGVRFEIPLLDGQKTGWFYDHRDNRTKLLPQVQGKTVLDLCSYLGAWGLQALKAGAKSATCVDISTQALAHCKATAEQNALNAHLELLQGDVFDRLQALEAAGRKFDIIIADPPAFIKSKKDKAVGMAAYQKLNRLSLAVLKPGGILISASCSMHLQHEDLWEVVQQAALKSQTQLQIIDQWHQSKDHPLHPCISETNYLKALVVYRVPVA